MAQPNLFSRRRWLHMAAGGLGFSLPGYLGLKQQAAAATTKPARAKRCIVLYCWGGISHIDTWDPKPDASAEIRGEFQPIETAAPGVRFGAHMPLLAKQADKLAVIRSIHHGCTAHGKGMYWNMTGHAPPQPEAAVNLPPSHADWPSLGSMVAKARGKNADLETSASPKSGVPPAVRLPYPLVDNSTLQAGEYGGWLGRRYDPIVVRTPGGTPFGGVSRDLGSPVLNMAEGIDRRRLTSRRVLLKDLERGRKPEDQPFDFFRQLAMDMLLSRRVREAFDLDREPERVRAAFGDHICGRSILLARRLTEVGVPMVTVCCAAGDLNGSRGDHWDTHRDNFNRLKKTMLPALDKPAAALLDDLAERGLLDETLVVFLTEFGRTPKINRSAGRDHYPHAYSVALAGGGIRGGQVYGSSDSLGAHPDKLPCGPDDLHATIFRAMGIPLDTHATDHLGRPRLLTDGAALPVF